MKFDERLEWFFDKRFIFLFRSGNRFFNPLIKDEMINLNTSKTFQDKEILNVINIYLPEFVTQLPTGMYFPTPIANLIKNGEVFSTELALKFHYEFIKIDKDQGWSIREKIISGKVLNLFKLNLFYEKYTKLYFVQYFSDDRWDKCYLECEVTPMLALSIFNIKNELKIQLNNQRIDSIDPKSFRVDKKERCFAQSSNFGEVMFADGPRFWMLDKLDKNGFNFVFKNKLFPVNFSS